MGETAIRLEPVIFGTSHLLNTAKHRKLLDDVHEIGCSVFDTARVYMAGQSERCLGRWLQERRLRNRVTIITKCGHPRFGCRLNRPALLKDIEASLKALRVDCLDCVLLHRDDPSADINVLLESLNEAIAIGKIRSYGFSNWQAARVREAIKCSDRHGLIGPSLSSPHFSLGVWTKAPWKGCVSIASPDGVADKAWYETSRFPVLAWSSLSDGFFAKALETSFNSATPRFPKPLKSVYESTENRARLMRASRLASARGVSVSQIVLAYVLQQPMNIKAIVSTHTKSHFKDNVAAEYLRLSSLELEWLNLSIDLEDESGILSCSHSHN